MIIDCISDLHGSFPKLDGGDLLIVAGDLTARGTEPEYFRFFDWLDEQKYKKKILIAGNHDDQMQEEDYKGPVGEKKGAFDYLCDSGTEFDGLKIWGSPWSSWFRGINPRCCAFTLKNDRELKDKWDFIPNDINILITHSPPHGIFDQIKLDYNDNKNVGCKHLRNAVLSQERFPNLKLHVFGHIHEMGGRQIDFLDRKFVNASLMNERYEFANKPVRVIL